MKKIKGIILAGGFGSRLYPLTYSTSKQLLPVYDKPMIYYPLSVLMKAGIKDILIICTKKDLNHFKDLLKDGDHLGLNFSYKIQNFPNGIAESFIIADDFIGNDNVCLILGDNIFSGNNFEEYLMLAKNNLVKGNSSIFGVTVENPCDFGVIEEHNGKIKIIEKPKQTQSNLIVSGLYFYTNDVINISKNLKPSKRNELEVTDVNNYYISNNKLKLIRLEKDISWIDTGTHESLVEASTFFRKIELKTSKKISCIEEIALNMGYIDAIQFEKLANDMSNSSYGKYLKKLTEIES